MVHDKKVCILIDSGWYDLSMVWKKTLQYGLEIPGGTTRRVHRRMLSLNEYPDIP